MGTGLRGGVGAWVGVALGLAVGLVPGCAGPIKPLPEARIAHLMARAELARERRFQAPVDAWEIEADAVEDLLAAELQRLASPEELRRDERLAHVLGLLAPDVDLQGELLAFQAGSVAGFFAPVLRRLYVVVGMPAMDDALTESVLVHELGHALQAEGIPLFDALVGMTHEDDLIFAIGALLEGDALFTEFRDESLQTGLPQRLAVNHSRQMDVERRAARDVPRLLRDTFYLQYPLGYALAESLVAAGGIEALDAALVAPPLSSEELLHPERYLDPSARRPRPDFQVPDERVVPPSCTVTSQTTAGELVVGIWLEEAGIDASRAASAADGWDGDRAWLIACPDGEAFAWLIQLDTEADAAELAAIVADTPWPGDAAALRDDVRSETRGRRVLASAGISDATRRFLLEELEERRHASLAEYLDDHPEVAARAEAIRSGVSAP